LQVLLLSISTFYCNISEIFALQQPQQGIKKRSAAPGDISFSYAATDIGSENGSHVKTITVIKNYALPSLDNNKTHTLLSDSRTHSEEYWPKRHKNHNHGAEKPFVASVQFPAFDISKPDGIVKTGPVEFPALNFPKQIKDFVAHSKFFEYQSLAKKTPQVTEKQSEVVEMVTTTTSTAAPESTKAPTTVMAATPTPEATTKQSVEEVKKMSSKITGDTPRPKKNRNRVKNTMATMELKRLTAIESPIEEDKPMKIIVDHLSLAKPESNEQRSEVQEVPSTTTAAAVTEKAIVEVSPPRNIVETNSLYNEMTTINLLPPGLKNSYTLSKISTAIARGDIKRVKQLAVLLDENQKGDSWEPVHKVKYIIDESSNQNGFISSQPNPNDQQFMQNAYLYPLTTNKPYLSPNVRNLVPIVVGRQISQPISPNLIQLAVVSTTNIPNPSSPMPVPVLMTTSKPFHAPKLISVRKVRQRRHRYRPRK
jgi:hypothetical protein